MTCTISEAIDIVRHYRNVAGHSEQTARLDAWILKAIGKPPGEATLADLQNVVLRNADRGSRSTYAARIRSIYKILNDAGVIDNHEYEQLPRVKPPRRLPRPFSTEQTQKLMQQLVDPHRSVVQFGLLTGARASEVWAFEGQDMTEGAHGWEILLRGKGGTLLKVPAHPDVVRLVNERRTLGRLFEFRDAAHLSRDVSAAIRAVLGPGHNFHQCRHTFGTRVYKASGNSLILTQQLLRHAEISSTLGYAAVADHAPRAAVDLLTV